LLDEETAAQCETHDDRRYAGPPESAQGARRGRAARWFVNRSTHTSVQPLEDALAIHERRMQGVAAGLDQLS
jgi:hypothetical protein